MYDPEKVGTFKMMFGFDQLKSYVPNDRRKKK